MKRSYRAPEDDFFCQKYQVWYPMRDCNLRLLQRTFEGCVNCFQGRVNLRRLHARPSLPPGSVPRPACNVLRFPDPAPGPAVLTRAPGAAPPKG